MRTGVGGVLVTVLAVPSSAVAQRVFDEELGATRPILAAALAAARLEGRPGAASIGAGEAQSGSDVWAQVQTVPAGTRVRVADVSQLERPDLRIDKRSLQTVAPKRSSDEGGLI